MNAVELTSARLRLRPLASSDVDLMHQLWTDPDVRKFLWDDVIIPRDQTAAVIAASNADFAERGYGLWGVRLINNDELVAFCGFRPSELGAPELLYGLAPAHWGHGFATEAARAALEYGFGLLGLTRVVAATDVPNRASARVLERLGMTLERHGLLNGLDTLFYALLRQDFETRRDV